MSGYNSKLYYANHINFDPRFSDERRKILTKRAKRIKRVREWREVKTPSGFLRLMITIVIVSLGMIAAYQPAAAVVGVTQTVSSVLCEDYLTYDVVTGIILEEMYENGTTAEVQQLFEIKLEEFLILLEGHTVASGENILFAHQYGQFATAARSFAIARSGDTGLANAVWSAVLEHRIAAYEALALTDCDISGIIATAQEEPISA